MPVETIRSGRAIAWIWTAVALTAFPGLSDIATAQESMPDFARAVGRAHGVDVWNGVAAVSAAMTVRFGDTESFSGRLITEPSMGRTRLDRRDGSMVLWDGREAWVSPAAAEFPAARFFALTLPYFLALPMKLEDPGVHLADAGTILLSATDRRPAVRLSFDPGTGDAPDDWYLLTRDPSTGRLDTVVYIVTYWSGPDSGKAETNAITYSDYRDIEGVFVPHRWTFRDWSRDTGLSEATTGLATLSDVACHSKLRLDQFKRPSDGRIDPHPRGR